MSNKYIFRSWYPYKLTHFICFSNELFCGTRLQTWILLNKNIKFQIHWLKASQAYVMANCPSCVRVCILLMSSPKFLQFIWILAKFWFPWQSKEKTYKNLNNLLLRKYQKIILQKCSLNDPLSYSFKACWLVGNHDRQGPGLFYLIRL